MLNKSFIAVGVFALMTGASMQAYAESPADLADNKVVVDGTGQVIRSIEFDNCVRTKWETETGGNPCAVVQEAKIEHKVVTEPAPPPPAPTPARQLTVDQRTVYFDFDKDNLRPDAQARLDNLATVLSSSSDVQHADIVGFADPMGNSNYNIKLSQRRAQTVKDYLAERGYVNTRVAETRGLGETQPVANCAGSDKRTAKIECLQPDRRVEVEIKFMETVMQPAAPAPAPAQYAPATGQ